MGHGETRGVAKPVTFHRAEQRLRAATEGKAAWGMVTVMVGDLATVLGLPVAYDGNGVAHVGFGLADASLSKTDKLG